MKAPVVALKQPGNHGPHPGSICKKICPQRPQPGKYDYFAQPESYSRSGAWEVFTEDCFGGRPPGGFFDIKANVAARTDETVGMERRRRAAGARTDSSRSRAKRCELDKSHGSAQINTAKADIDSVKSGGFHHELRTK